jgi:hypothetical protein
MAAPALPDRPRVNPATAGKTSGMREALKARAHHFLVAGIFLLTTGTEEENMNLEELRGKSSAELRDIYNGLVDNQVKRFADRVTAEQRTAVALQENGLWSGPLPSNKKGDPGAKPETGASRLRNKIAAKKAANAPEKPAKAKPEPKAPAKKSAAKKTPAAKPEKAPKPATGEGKGAGAPKTNLTYIAQETDKRMHSESARTKVYNFFKEQGKKGADREAAENAFVDDENISVKSAIDYLLKMGMLVVKEG